ncbi:MAG: family 31 glucosidase [Clostridia bacterium]|nr:family 31 glucosidase [Clostridia bacterium]
MFLQDGQTLVYQYDFEKVRIEPWGRDSLRVRSTLDAEFPQENWALLSPTDTDSIISIEEQSAEIQNGKIKARVQRNGKIIFLNEKGDILLEEYLRTRLGYIGTPIKERQGFASALHIDARGFRPLIGGDYHLTVKFESDPTEKLFGMGQYQQPFFDLKGMEFELAHRNSQASIPFVLSSKGYGFLWNNPAIGQVTFGKNITSWTAESTKAMDYWITAGSTPAEIEEHYADATGKVPMMPDYAMGFWQCKLRYQTQDELLSIAREYKKRNLPIDVIVVDFFHWPFQGDWRFDPDYWPDPEGMVKELEEMGIKLMVSVWPTVDFDSENYEEMLQRGMLIRAERGVRITMTHRGRTVFFDPTNPEAREFVWEKCKKNYYDKGIHIFWLDEAEPEYNVYDFDNYRYHIGTNLQIGNLYPVEYARTFYEGMEKAGQKNIINLIRCAWAGSQKYGTLVWSGDIDSSFRAFRDQFAAGLHMGISGIPWWTTDIGGFHGGNPKDPAFQELLARWFAYGCFCPVMRLHGYRDPQSKPIGTSGGGLTDSGAANEVWAFGDENYEICKKYLFLRERMKPYIRELMQAAHEKGTPVIRPLFYEFPQDPACWEQQESYMFGPDVLVAPVMYAGMKQRSVYLPTGKDWTDFHTGKVYHGGQTVTVDTPIDVIPVFTTNGRTL